MWVEILTWLKDLHEIEKISDFLYFSPLSLSKEKLTLKIIWLISL